MTGTHNFIIVTCSQNEVHFHNASFTSISEKMYINQITNNSIICWDQDCLDPIARFPESPKSQSLTFFLKFEFYSTDIHFNTSTSSILLLSFHFHFISIFQLPHVWVIIDVSPATFDESEWRDINGRGGVTAPLCLSISTHNSSRCWQNDAVLTEFAWCVNAVS